MVRRVFSFLWVLLASVAAFYLVDLAVLHLRKNQTGSVTVRPYTEVPRNDKREELIFDQPHDETCVNSLFPHQALSPCWYLRRYPEKEDKL